MTHPSTERLWALVEGELDRETETALLAHVETCEICLEWFEQESAARQIPLEIGTNQGDPGLFRRRLMHRINREQTHNGIIHLFVTGFLGLFAFVLSTLHLSQGKGRAQASHEHQR